MEDVFEVGADTISALAKKQSVNGIYANGKSVYAYSHPAVWVNSDVFK